MGGQTILIALDGSELSEKPLPYATALARATDASVHLVTVWEEGERALIANIPEVSDSAFEQGEKHWERYLTDLAAPLQAEGFDVGTDVLIGDPAPEILDLIDQLEAGYLIVATHGRSGLSRWRYGSVANRLVREAPVPTFVVGPSVLQADRGGPAVRRVLVPLDGSPLAETALRPALELADKLGAELLLAQVHQWATQTFMYGIPDVNITSVDEQLSEAAASYLKKVRDSLKPTGRVETVVLHGPTADALISLIAERDVDLVVMTSHTRTGVARTVLGSVADRLLHGEAPVLLIRPVQPH